MKEKTLSREEFEVLSLLAQSDSNQTQQEIANHRNIPVNIVNTLITALNEQGYLTDRLLTEEGYAALEPYRVKRAVFIAAGFGSRLVPITLNTPKPLVRVNGKRMIDTLLDAVLAAGINEIYVVRGYLGEQFDQLLYKYPMIRFIENPIYNEANNISSALCARHLFQNAYVFDADLVLSTPRLITKYQYTSNYLGVPVDVTDDWCFETQNRVITQVNIGGRNCHQMFGISYWTSEDGSKLYKDIKTVYEMPGGKDLYWDQVPLVYCSNHYQIEVRECSFEDIIEIDSYSELKEKDSSYC